MNNSKQNNESNLIEWKNFLLKLPDKSFFSLMTFYLGEIPTPFSKQKLIENLIALFKKDEVQQTVITSISIQELYFCACIILIETCTFEILSDIFQSELNQYQVEEVLLQLEQRLIIFKTKDETYRITPILERNISTLCNFTTFLHPIKRDKQTFSNIRISTLDILAMYSFLIHNPNPIKSNGELKKKVVEKLSSIFFNFASESTLFHFLVRAFLNLRLFYVTNSGIVENEIAWQSFAKLHSREMQLAIIVASTGCYTEKYFKFFVKSLHSFFSLLEYDCWYDIGDLEKALKIIMIHIKSQFNSSDICVFPHLEYESFFDTQQKQYSVIDIAIMFGFLIKQDNMVILNSEIEVETENNALLISPSFEITMFPVSNIEPLLPIIPALQVKSVQATAVFELTRKSCVYFFEHKGTFDELETYFNLCCAGQVPQNVLVSLQQWYSNFSSIKLFSGIVAVVSKAKSNLFEKNMPLHHLVKEKISDTVFFLHSSNTLEVKEILDSVGLEYLFEKTVKPTVYMPRFVFSPFADEHIDWINVLLKQEKKQTRLMLKEEFLQQGRERNKKNEEYTSALEQRVLTSPLTELEIDLFNEYLRRKMIIHESQLTREHLVLENMQISALDHSAKLRTCESAISQKKRLELSVKTPNGLKKFFCTPIEVIRTPKKDILKLYLTKNTSKIKMLDISKIIKIHILSEAIF
ncbi:MAG: hypothetical protein IJU92_09505 [Spirochaetaceae bacterium]|nr:hypothetical protein [Spirochaetaceae bacterium]